MFEDVEDVDTLLEDEMEVSFAQCRGALGTRREAGGKDPLCHERPGERGFRKEGLHRAAPHPFCVRHGVSIWREGLGERVEWNMDA